MSKSKNRARQSCRTIQSLEWAKLAPMGPWGNKKPRAKGVKAKGLAYERKVGVELSRLVSSDLYVHSGQWIHFQDSQGLGWAQPDYYIVADNGILLLECKLSQKREAWDQLRNLYAPLLEFIYGTQVLCTQVCKHLSFDDGSIVTDFAQLRDGSTWHWMGH